MEDKFRKEDHNRQDKARKADYRQDLVQESQRKADPEHVRSFKVETLHRGDLIKRYREGSYFNYQTWIGLDWNLEQFASRNRLSIADPATRLAFNHNKKYAERDFAAIVEAIRSGKAKWDYYGRECEWGPRVEIKVRLRCDIVVPRRTPSESYPIPLSR